MTNLSDDPRCGDLRLLADLANRIAEISLAMGMDDDDELLLWRYVARTPKKEILESVRSALQSAVYDPYVLSRCEWTACFPERFYNQARRVKSRFGKRYGLTQRGDQSVLKGAVKDGLIHDIEEFKARLVEMVRYQCFLKWINEVESILDPNGIKWHAPGQEHVSVHTLVEGERLADKLGN